MPLAGKYSQSDIQLIALLPDSERYQWCLWPCLQIREEPVQSGVQGPLQEGGLETQLAHAEACLISGQLLAAAAQLQKAVQVHIHL